MRGILKPRPGVYAHVERAQLSLGYELYVTAYAPDGDESACRVLLPGGTGWREAAAGERMEPALVLPVHVLGSVVEAFVELARGGGADPDAETRAVREALVVERARVDQMLAVVTGRVA